MTERYLAKVVKILDEYSIVVNGGSDRGLKVGNQYMVVGLSDTILDPETNEDLGQLEIVKGKVEVVHVQERLATLKSCGYGRSSEKREIKKVTMSGKGGLVSMFGPQDTITESIIPSEPIILKLENVALGDVLIKA